MHSLAVTDQGISLRAEGDSLLLCRGDTPVGRQPVRELEQVLLVGRIELTSGAVLLLLRRNVDVVWLTQRGEYRGRLAGRSSRNVSLRLAQYRRATDEEFCRRVAASVIAGKIRQQRQTLLRAQRRLRDDELAVAVGQLRTLAGRIHNAPALDSLRGLEGQAAATYFGQFGKLLRNPQFAFGRRTRRPPRDEVNALLSFGYAVLGNIVETELYRCGLDPMLGFFHQPAYGRPSLMLDFLEEFRPSVDSLVLRVINRRQLSPRDFVHRSGQELAALLQEDSATEREVQTPFDDRPFDDRHGGPLANDAQVEPPAPALDLPAAVPDDASGLSSGEAELDIGVYLGDTGRKIFLNELFCRLRERLYYPPRDARLELREIIRQQIYLLARVIEGKADSYEPVAWD